MTSTVKRLQQARALIADPEHWTRFEFARDANGTAVTSSDPRAVCWCARGAVSVVGGGVAELDALTLAADVRFGTVITQVNDYRDHDDVLRMFDTAIEKASER